MVGRIVVLLVLILAIVGGGLVWFDYLNLIDVKTTLAPLYKFIGREGRTQKDLGDTDLFNLDAERLAIRLEAEALRELEIEKQEEELNARKGELEQMAEEVAQQKQALEDQQNSINEDLKLADIVSRNIEGIAVNLNGMPPERAVDIIAKMDDQQAIDVLRKTEEIAQRDGTASIVPYWMSLMDSARAAELSRKMVGRPE